MKYPISKEDFVKVWCQTRKNKNEYDEEYAEALVSCLNAAYNQGLEDGMRKAVQHE